MKPPGLGEAGTGTGRRGGVVERRQGAAASANNKHKARPSRLSAAPARSAAACWRASPLRRALFPHAPARRRPGAVALAREKETDVHGAPPAAGTHARHSSGACPSPCAGRRETGTPVPASRAAPSQPPDAASPPPLRHTRCRTPPPPPAAPSMSAAAPPAALEARLRAASQAFQRIQAGQWWGAARRGAQAAHVLTPRVRQRCSRPSTRARRSPAS